jgi:hypothetical protein
MLVVAKHGNNLNNDVCNAMSYLKPVLISQSIQQEGRKEDER